MTVWDQVRSLEGLVGQVIVVTLWDQVWRRDREYLNWTPESRGPCGVGPIIRPGCAAGLRRHLVIYFTLVICPTTIFGRPVA